MGGNDENKMTKEEIVAQGETQKELISSVNENIEAVQDICEKIKNLELEKIEGLAELDDGDEVSGLRGIKLTKKQEKSLKKKNR